METCEACGKPIVGPIIKVVSGNMSEDGEFEAQNTETWHPGCVEVDRW